jgi:SAM-dependent methyltransferase
MRISPNLKRRISGLSVSDYFLGHSQIELQRLMMQEAMLRPFTERLLRSAGLRGGMRVLDLGCGAGDVSMLAAQLVGPDGTVVGIDPAAAAVALATERVERAAQGKRPTSIPPANANTTTTPAASASGYERSTRRDARVVLAASAARRPRKLAASSARA